MEGFSSYDDRKCVALLPMYDAEISQSAPTWRSRLRFHCCARGWCGFSGVRQLYTSNRVRRAVVVEAYRGARLCELKSRQVFWP